jgi:hypothetical protein
LKRNRKVGAGGKPAPDKNFMIFKCFFASVLTVPLFLLFSSPSFGSESETEEVIMKLVQAVRDLPDGTEFVRNGESHTKDEAVRHLLSKYEKAKKKIASPEDFIEKIASRSYLSGKDYLIRFSDNKTVPAGDFFKLELEKINSNKAK